MLKLLTFLWVILGGVPCFALPVETSKTPDGFRFESDSFLAKISPSGDVTYFQIKSRNYKKVFIEAAGDGKSLAPGQDRKGLLQGIRFGFPLSPSKILTPISAKFLEETPNVLVIRLKDQNPKSSTFGLTVDKIIEVGTKDYQISLKLRLSNPGSRPIPLGKQSDLKSQLGLMFGLQGGGEYWDTYLSGKKADLSEIQGDLEDHWTSVEGDASTMLGFRNQYFILGLFLENPSKFHALKQGLDPVDDQLPLSIYSSFIPVEKDSLQPNEVLNLHYPFFLGEKREVALQETVFFPFFDKYSQYIGGIQRLMFQTLTALYNLTHSYGWAILCLTLIVKLILLPLNIKQTRSMAKMQEVQPEMKELQERHKDDRQKLNAEMMKLYQKHQVNPLAGCLPMIIQLPIFFSLFYTVGGSVEMYGETFLWVKDLARADTTEILPLLFVGSFVLSQKKMTVDPNQKILIYVLPVMFFFMMRSLAAGVMLYIVGQSLFSNIEQLIIKGRKTAGDEPIVDSNSQGPPHKKRKKKGRRRKTA
jgi:YidC/Oxa1 family membrane protein insertase